MRSDRAARFLVAYQRVFHPSVYAGVENMSEPVKVARKLQVQFKHDVTREQVLAAVESVFRISGCPACGIRGIDLILQGGDPASQFGPLQGMPGISGVIGA
jgi:hypothetical protein